MRRRRLVIGIIIIALSIGLVFSILPYLQAPPPHFSITTSENMTVSGGTASYPGFNALKLPNITNSGKFYIGITVTGGNASFCPMAYQTYENWAVPYSTNKYPPFPTGSCVQPLSQISQETYSFLPPSSGTWVIVALNNNPSQISVLFSPA